VWPWQAAETRASASIVRTEVFELRAEMLDTPAPEALMLTKWSVSSVSRRWADFGPRLNPEG
jgi:hypothetical protein